MKDLVALAVRFPHDPTKRGPIWLKARATALSFSLLPTPLAPLQENTHDSTEEEEPRADTDVLPTLLAYRDGELVHSWIRVDWCAVDGVEVLLRR